MIQSVLLKSYLIGLAAMILALALFCCLHGSYNLVNLTVEAVLPWMCGYLCCSMSVFAIWKRMTK